MRTTRSWLATGLPHGRLPAVALPAGQPRGDGLHRVLRVHPDLERHARVGRRQQALQRGQFRDVVGGLAERPRLPAHRALGSVGYDPGPARGPRVSLRSPVARGHNTFTHGLDHAMAARSARPGGPGGYDTSVSFGMSPSVVVMSITEKFAPCGSLMAANRPNGVVIGPKRRTPPSLAAFATASSQSSTVK